MLNSEKVTNRIDALSRIDPIISTPSPVSIGSHQHDAQGELVSDGVSDDPASSARMMDGWSRRQCVCPCISGGLE